jgi:diguanylate cyclase (GGDEF)-like protein
VLAAFHRSSFTGWTVTIGMPLDSIEQNLKIKMAWLLSFGLCALLIGQCLAWWIASRLSGAMKALTKPAAALAAGEILKIPSLPFKEANEMRSALISAGEKMMRHQYAAHHDSLTGLANRGLFTHQVEQAMVLCRREKASMAVLFIDLDAFKAVNDTLGHATGDDLLRSVADRLRHAVRESDVVARFGGDEFAAMLMRVDANGAIRCAEKIIAALSAPYAMERGEAKIGASIGVAIYPDAAEEAEELMQVADEAMYDAKHAGKGGVMVGPTSEN